MQPTHLPAIAIPLSCFLMIGFISGCKSIEAIEQDLKSGYDQVVKLATSSESKRGETSSTKQEVYEEKDYAGTQKFVQGIGILSSLGGAVLCAKANLSEKVKAFCVLGSLGSLALTKVLSEKVVQHLQERDKVKALEAAGDSLDTGEPTTIELPDSQATLTISPIDQPVFKETESDLLIDKKTLTEIYPIEGIGNLYQAQDPGEIRSGAGKEFSSIGKIQNGEILHVLGKVANQPWLMVARMIDRDEFSTSPYGIGYVPDGFIRPAGKEVEIASQEKDLETLEPVKIKTVLKCQKQNMKLIKENGDIVESGETLNCRGIDGYPVSL